MEVVSRERKRTQTIRKGKHEQLQQATKTTCCAQKTRLPGQLKFVVTNEDRAWKEMEDVISIFRDNGVLYPVWIMPVGATAEQQATDHIKQIAYRAMKSGYNISARVHTYLFGNVIGS
jgi:hypothetical protein